MPARPSSEPDVDLALHGSWYTIARLTVLISALAAVVWVFGLILNGSITWATTWLFETARSGSLYDGQLLLFGALIGGGLVRAALMNLSGWRATAANSFDLALDNFHSTSRSGAVPADRYKRPGFSLAVKKTVATLLTIGSGGAGGITAPMVTISEALGTGWAHLTGAKTTSELRTYQLAAIAAAFSTLFRAPFAGALFAIEVVYGDRIVYRRFVFCLLAAIVAFGLTEYLLPLDPIYSPPPHDRIYGFFDYAVTTVVAIIVSGPVVLGFGWVMVRSQALVAHYNPYASALTGTILTGLVAITLWELLGMDPKHVLGTGRESLNALFTGDDPNLKIWWFLAVMVVGRMLTVAFTAVGGGSIGLFLPAAFFGGVSGAAMAELLNASGMFGHLDSTLFVVVGIASALVVMVRIPLAAIALIMEVFGATYGPAAALACAVTYTISLRVQIYRNQPRSAGKPDTGGAGH